MKTNKWQAELYVTMKKREKEGKRENRAVNLPFLISWVVDKKGSLLRREKQEKKAEK